MDSKDKPYNGLGYMNGWYEIPKEVIFCRGNNHQTEEKKIYRNVVQITCETCKISYNIDSSD